MMTELARSQSAPAGVPQAPSAAPGARRVSEEQSNPVRTLLSFANNQEPAGPISHTAARQLADQGLGGIPLSSQAQSFVPVAQNQGLVNDIHAAGYGPGHAARWAPFATPNKTARQADLVAKMHKAWHAQNATDAFWGVHFFQDVAKLDQQEGIAGDLLAMLQSFGFNGANSVGALRPGL